MNYQKLKELAKKATPGPLEVVRYDETGGMINYQIESEIQQNIEHTIVAHFGEFGNPSKAKQDAFYYAAANPETVLKLIDRYEQVLEDANQWAEKLAYVKLVVAKQREAMKKDIDGAGEVTGPIYHEHIRAALIECDEILNVI